VIIAQVKNDATYMIQKLLEEYSKWGFEEIWEKQNILPQVFHKQKI
jgi:hypothetical protein